MSYSRRRDVSRRMSISISFTPQQAEFLTSCVASGRYQSTSEVVREAIRLLEDRVVRREAELEHLRRLIREGADDIDRGDVVDAEAFFAEWDAELDDLERRSRS